MLTRGMLSAIPSTYFRIGSKFRCIRSTPTEMQSMSENDFECFASTGVKTPETMFPNRTRVNLDIPQADPSCIPPAALGGVLHLGETVISGVSHFKAADGAQSQS